MGVGSERPLIRLVDCVERTPEERKLYREAREAKQRARELAASAKASETFVDPLDDFLIGDGFLRRHRVHSIIGAPGSGKSLVLIHASLCLATKKPFFGLPTEQCRVAFFACEAGASTLARFRVAAEKMQVPWPLPDIRIPTEALNLRSSTWQRGVIQFLLDMGASVAFVDTANASGSGAEDAVDMGAYAAGCQEIVRRTGVALMVSHHPPIGCRANEVRERGHGSLRGTLDVSIGIHKEIADDDVTEHVMLGSKMRDGDGGEFGRFRVETVQIGTNNLGQDVMVPYVVPMASDPAIRTSVGLRRKKRDLAQNLLLEEVPETDDPTKGVASEALADLFKHNNISISELGRTKRRLGISSHKTGSRWLCYFPLGKKKKWLDAASNNDDNA